MEVLRRKKLIFWEVCFPNEAREMGEGIIRRGTEAQMYGILAFQCLFDLCPHLVTEALCPSVCTFTLPTGP